MVTIISLNHYKMLSWGFDYFKPPVSLGPLYFFINPWKFEFSLNSKCFSSAEISFPFPETCLSRILSLKMEVKVVLWRTFSFGIINLNWFPPPPKLSSNQNLVVIRIGSKIRSKNVSKHWNPKFSSENNFSACKLRLLCYINSHFSSLSFKYYIAITCISSPEAA